MEEIRFTPLILTKPSRMMCSTSKMTRTILFPTLVLLISSAANADDFFSHSVKDANGNSVALSKYQDKQVLLVVNVASQCGFTAQYTGIQALHTKYGDRGFEVLAFPCNQFGGQEPASDQEIQQFAKDKYETEFPIFAKIDVNGRKADPLFTFLKSEATDAVAPAGWNPGLPEKDIQWNFTKFLLVGGRVYKRYSFDVTPEQIEIDIQTALKNAEL